MAPKLKETLTDFGGGPESRHGASFSPTGTMGRFFKKFFAAKIKNVLGKDVLGKNGQISQGDTLITAEPTFPIKGRRRKGGGGHVDIDYGSGGSLILPEVEISRRRRYAEFEKMDEYPEIGAAFDIYADDCTQKDIKKKRWVIKSENSELIASVNEMFMVVKLDRTYWDITRNVCKYGDNILETIIDENLPELGIQRLKMLNPKYIIRVETEYGELLGFLQEIPEKSNYNYTDVNNDFSKRKYIQLDKNQIVHFKLDTADPIYYPYGKGVASTAQRVFKSLKMMEDAMLIYRLARAPERRVFYIDIGNLSTNKAEAYIERLKQKFKKEKFYNQTNNSVDERYNAIAPDEDFFIPHRGNRGTKVETLPGAQNLGDVDDVKYFRDKLLASMKVPKDYIVEKDKSPERKANLSQLDVKFARACARIQHNVEVGLEEIAKRHLVLIGGFSDEEISLLRIELPDPSDMFTKRKLDLDAAKIEIVAKLIETKLFPKKHLYKEYYDLTDEEIEEIEQLLEEEFERDLTQLEAETEIQTAPDMEMAKMSAEVKPAPTGSPTSGTKKKPSSKSKPVKKPATGGRSADSRENASPTSKKESILHHLEAIKERVILKESFQENNFEKMKVLNRLIKKYKSQVKNEDL